jgi:hypothetical protein
MISMVMDINKTQFGGKQVVTCYTCHNGRPIPADMPVFPVLEPVAAAKPVLPAVDQILTKYVQALGGEQAIRKVTSRTITGTQYIPTGPGGTTPMPAVVERYQKAPNVIVTTYRTPTYAISQGFDGTTAWSQDQAGRVADTTAFMLDDAFPVIGMRPFLGRGFTADELRPKGPPAAVISHRLWVSRFHSDRSLVGRTIRINGVAATLVGVMPPQLLLIGTDLWIPWGARPDQAPRDLRSFSVIARLASGASIRTAESELATIAARIASRSSHAYSIVPKHMLCSWPLPQAMTISPACAI